MKPLDDLDLSGDGFLAGLVQSSIDCVMVLDLEGSIRSVNPCGVTLMEAADSAALVGRPWLGLWMGEDRERARAALNVARGGETGRCQVACSTLKGAPKSWDLVISPLRHGDGDPVGVIASLRDVTDLVEAREAAVAREFNLERTLAVLHSAGRVAKVGAWEIDYRTGLVFFTDELWALIGHPPRAEIRVEEAVAFWGEPHRERIGALAAEAVAAGDRLDYEAEFQRACGETIWVRVLADPVFDDTGVCVALRGAVQDITAEHTARIRLQESERFTRGVIDGMSASICVLDENGTILTQNQAWRDFRKNNPASSLGDGLGLEYRAACRRVLGRVGHQLARALDAILEGRRTAFEAEYPFHTPAEKRWVKLNAYRVPGDGPMRVVVMHQPITDLKLGEQRLRRANSTLKAANRAAKAASAAKSAFLATMSHEIRTPLNGVLGMAQAMANDPLPPVQRERLDVVRQSGEALLMLLNDVLDLSKIEAGKLDLEDGVVDIEEIAQGARAAFSSIAASKALHFGLDVTPPARGLWRGDPIRVRQVLYNLVSNAVKFTERGAIQVEISHDGRDLIMRIADTGPGVPLALRVRLFSKFVQADASTTRRYGGTGLGLAICREIVHLMDGEISVDSILGEGSTFCVRLPLSRAENQAPVAAAAPVVLDAGSGLRILAAEDNPMNVLVLKTLLSQVGVEPYVVGDGAAAVKAWNEAHWDVILMDVQMPVMDGPTAATQIRDGERALGRARTPIIALTANAMAHHAAEYAAIGMDALVSKPIDLARLLATMDSVLSVDENEPEGRAACA